MMEIISHTPKWVFALLAALIFLGWRQSRDRTAKPAMIFLLPLAMIALSYSGVSSSFGTNLSSAGSWAISLIVTLFVGTRFFPVKGTVYQPDQGVFLLKGSWVPMLLILAIFFTKYFIGFTKAVNPDFIRTDIVIISFSLIYGLLSGAFAARALSIWQARKYA